MTKKKGFRIILTIECLNCRKEKNKRSKGISHYTTTKNRQNTPNRLELKKFCVYCNFHTLHKEIK